MRRFLLTVAAAATTLAGTACSDSTGIGGNVAGSYELQAVNGQSLPVSDGTVTIEAGVLELDSDGTFVDIVQFRIAASPLIQEDSRFGTWDRSGNEIRLEYDDNNDVYFADRQSSSRLVVEDNDGNTWEYRRF